MKKRRRRRNGPNHPCQDLTDRRYGPHGIQARLFHYLMKQGNPFSIKAQKSKAEIEKEEESSSRAGDDGDEKREDGGSNPDPETTVPFSQQSATSPSSSSWFSSSLGTH